MKYFDSSRLPAIVYLCLLVAFTLTAMCRWKVLLVASNILLGVLGLAFLGLIAASIWNFIRKRWRLGVHNLLWVLVCSMATLVAFSLVVFVSLSSMDSPRGDGFADNLTIPEGIEIADPDLDVSGISLGMADMGSDEWQDLVRKALAEPGYESTEFSPRIPSLRKASIDYADTLIDYLEASPNWHVFLERGNRFAFRRWS